MKVAIAHMGPISEIVAASSVNHGVKKQSIDTDITWVVPDEHAYIFKYNKDIKKTISLDEFENSKEKYNLFINLWPTIFKTEATLEGCMGFGFYKEFGEFEKALLNNYSFPNMSNLQLYFILAGLTWKGEGYDIGYYPKTKTKKNRIGMSAANANLRNYVLDNLEVDDKKIWYIPYKKNIFKKMDEINRCQKIITDDLLTFHLALALRKHVYYLETYPHTLRLELFKSGQVYSVPYSYLK